MRAAPDGDGYERRIGRYGPELATELIRVTAVTRGQRALDVGCGSGALTVRLADVLGPDQVAAVDPDPDAVRRCAERVPGADVRVGVAEALPFSDGEFDVVLAQLVVPLVADADRAAREMHRVARPGARVATCVWDFAGGMTVLRAFWDAAIAIGAPGAAEQDQGRSRPYANPDDLARLWSGAGSREVTTGAITAGTDYADFDDLWTPLTIPDGGPGRFFASLEAPARESLREELRRRLGNPQGPFRLTARAWVVAGIA